MLIDRLGLNLFSPAVRMIIRNLERKPWKAIASAFAICCSLMIVVVEFGLFDAMDRMMKVQFQDVQPLILIWVEREMGGSGGAAARLGLKRTTLIGKMKKLGITRPVPQNDMRTSDDEQWLRPSTERGHARLTTVCLPT